MKVKSKKGALTKAEKATKNIQHINAIRSRVFFLEEHLVKESLESLKNILVLKEFNVDNKVVKLKSKWDLECIENLIRYKELKENEGNV